MLKKVSLFLLCLVAIVLMSGNADAALIFGGSSSGSGVFKELAGKTGQFASGLRNLAYVISGFGIIMFTFLAICGKINFKHLGYIVICLFFLSGMGSLIVYIKGGDSTLTYNFNDTYTKAGVGRFSSM